MNEVGRLMLPDFKSIYKATVPRKCAVGVSITLQISGREKRAQN